MLLNLGVNVYLKLKQIRGQIQEDAGKILCNRIKNYSPGTRKFYFLR
ncbi:MAG: hypothetical protein QM791_14110 [Ferruginibacter sp.]